MHSMLYSMMWPFACLRKYWGVGAVILGCCYTGVLLYWGAVILGCCYTGVLLYWGAVITNPQPFSFYT